MPLKIKVYSDYVCPYCFLAEQPLEEAVKDKDVEIEWMPFELRPYPKETLKPEGDYLQQSWKQGVFPVAERMGIHIVLPNVSPQPHTHLAFEGFQYAKANGKGNVYNKRIFRAFFQEEKDIGNIDVLANLAEEIGLDKACYRAALENRTFRETHKKALEHAYREVRISVVPTFVIGETIITGLHSKDELEEIINKEINKPYSS